MAEPILGTVAAVAQLAGQAKKGWQFLVGEQPEYHHFWKRFSHTVGSRSNDLPVQRIEDHYRLNPDFVSWTCGVVRGEHDKLVLLEASFRAELTPPSSSNFDQDEMVVELMRAVDDAAAHAVPDMAAAFLQTRNQLRWAIEEGRDATITEVRAARSESSAGQQYLEQQLAPLSEIPSLANGIRELSERLDREQDDQRLTGTPSSEGRASDRGLEPENLEVVPVRSLAETGDVANSIEELLVALSCEDPEGTRRIRDLLEDGGPLSVVTHLRTREGPGEDGLAFFVTTARIAARAGAFEEAEIAYLWAAEVNGLDERTRVRQIVRAAHMAHIHDEGRFQALLQQAKELVPEHPAIAIAEARETRDAALMLERVKDVDPESDQEAALVHVTRAQADLALGAIELAEEELALAQAVDPTNTSVTEFEGTLPLVAAKHQLNQGQEVDPVALTQAAEKFEQLRPELEQQGRWDESARIGARAAEARALAGDSEAAIEVLEGVKRLEQLSHEARLDLGQAAMVARRPDLVLRLVGASDPSASARVLRADALSLSEDPDERRASLELLGDLLEDESEAVQRSAAFALLGAAATSSDVEWDERAEAIISGVRPLVTATFRSGYLRQRGDMEDAERVLLPFASEPQSLRLLRDLAAQRGDWEKARDRSRSTLQTGGSAHDRLADADIRRRIGDGQAKEDFLSLARDEGTPDETREAAFSVCRRDGREAPGSCRLTGYQRGVANCPS